MGAAKNNLLAESWRTRLDRGERELEVWTDGALTVYLHAHAIRIRAGGFMDVELPLDEVHVHTGKSAARLDWENGEIDIDTGVGEALVAYGIRLSLQDEVDDPMDESVDLGDWSSTSTA